MAMRGKIRELTKVKRYWPGKAPEWANDRDTCSSDEEEITILYKSFPTRDDDPRQRRLAERRSVKRRTRRAEIVDTTEEEEEEEEEEDAETLEERRRRIKERLLRQMEQEQQQEEFKTDDYSTEDESDEDYSEEEEDEIAGEVVTVKPVFLSKSTRDTIVERKRLEEAEEQALEARRRELEERKKETRRMVLEEIRKDEEIHKGLMNQDSANDDVDTDINDPEEDTKAAWKARERARLKKERAAREVVILKEIEKMNDQVRREYWERKNPPSSPAPQPRKRKLKFMQRDYHRGAFFRSDPDDEDGVLGRDYSTPTGEDKMDKTRLPKVMQVKNFGRRGRAKWTHLVNEDTTDWNSPWMWNDRQRSGYNVKMAAMNAPIARPKGNKRLRFSVKEDEL